MMSIPSGWASAWAHTERLRSVSQAGKPIPRLEPLAILGDQADEGHRTSQSWQASWTMPSKPGSAGVSRIA